MKKNLEMTKGKYLNELCPQCSAKLVGNSIGDKWCSYLHCDYGITDFTKKGMAASVCVK